MQSPKSVTERYGLTLNYVQEEEEGFYELLGGSTPDFITYRPVHVHKLFSHVTGFIWHHPCGLPVTGEFPLPVLALVAVTESGGIPDFTRHYTAIEKAIRERLGSFSHEELDMCVENAVDLMARAE